MHICALTVTCTVHFIGTGCYISSHVVDLHTRGILLIVYSRYRPPTWSVGIHSVGQRPEVYGALLEEFPKGFGDTTYHEYSLSHAYRWSVKEEYTGVRGYVANMRPGS